MHENGRNRGYPAVFFCVKSEKGVAFYVNSFYTKNQRWGRVEPNPINECLSGGEVEQMTGTYEHSIDAKGRLFIPAKLREELGVSFYLAMGIDTCLAIYPQSTWDKFTEKFASLPMTQSKVMRPLFANAVKCELDSQGRIVIPQKLRKYAKLEKDAVIIGVNDRAEIWSAELWSQDEEEMTPEKMAECMSMLGF